MASKHICPQCGCKRFITVAHVAQSWVVDEEGEFIATASECDEVVASPDDGNTWTCDNCGAEAVIVDESEADPSPLLLFLQEEVPFRLNEILEAACPDSDILMDELIREGVKVLWENSDCLFNYDYMDEQLTKILEAHGLT